METVGNIIKEKTGKVRVKRRGAEVIIPDTRALMIIPPIEEKKEVVPVDTKGFGIMGRPTVMTELAVAKLEEAFLLGCTDEEACFYADISTTTLYRYQQDNPDFWERKGLLKESPIFAARKCVVTEVAKNPEMAYRFLKDKKPKEFAREELPGGNVFNQQIINNNISNGAVEEARKLEADDKDAIVAFIKQQIASDEQEGKV